MLAEVDEKGILQVHLQAGPATSARGQPHASCGRPSGSAPLGTFGTNGTAPAPAPSYRGRVCSPPSPTVEVPYAKGNCSHVAVDLNSLKRLEKDTRITWACCADRARTGRWDREVRGEGWDGSGGEGPSLRGPSSPHPSPHPSPPATPPHLGGHVQVDDEVLAGQRPEEHVEVAAREAARLRARRRQLQVVAGGRGAADPVDAAAQGLVLKEERRAGSAGGPRTLHPEAPEAARASHYRHGRHVALPRGPLPLVHPEVPEDVEERLLPSCCGPGVHDVSPGPGPGPPTTQGTPPGTPPRGLREPLSGAIAAASFALPASPAPSNGRLATASLPAFLDHVIRRGAGSSGVPDHVI